MLRSILTVIPFAVAAAAAVSQTPLPIPPPDGTRLALGDFCYTIVGARDGKEQAIGLTFQSIRRQQVDGVDALAIVVHQHFLDGSFEMRDSFLLRRADLRPIRLDTQRSGKPHVHLDYIANRVTGWKMEGDRKQPIDLTFDGPVWDGNLWGVTFAALPLKTGQNYQLPEYQYDTGKGTFLMTVSGQRKFDTPAGPADALSLRAGLKSDQMVDYFIGVAPHLELGYAAGPYSQHLGGDCSDLH